MKNYRALSLSLSPLVCLLDFRVCLPQRRLKAQAKEVMEALARAEEVGACAGGGGGRSGMHERARLAYIRFVSRFTWVFFSWFGAVRGARTCWLALFLTLVVRLGSRVRQNKTACLPPHSTTCFGPEGSPSFSRFVDVAYTTSARRRRRCRMPPPPQKKMTALETARILRTTLGNKKRACAGCIQRLRSRGGALLGQGGELPVCECPMSMYPTSAALDVR